MVDELKIEDGQFAFTDLDRPKPFERRFGPINVRLTKFTTRPQQGSPYSIVVDTAGWRDVRVVWRFYAHAAAFRRHVQADRLHVNKYAAYIEDAMPMQILDGRVDFATDYSFAMPGEAISLAVSNAVLDITGLQVAIAQPKPARAAIDRLHLTVSGVSARHCGKECRSRRDPPG